MPTTDIYDGDPTGMSGVDHYGVATIGVPGANIPFAGEHGPALLGLDVVHPTEDSDEFRVLILTVPSGLTRFECDELSRVVAEGPPGIYTGLRRGYKNGVPYAGAGGYGAGEAPFTILIGQGLTGAADLDSMTAAGALQTAAASALGGDAQLDSIIVTGGAIGQAAPISLDAFKPFILPHAPGLPWELAEHHVRQACIEWFQRTLCWRYCSPVFNTTPGRDTYPLPLPTGTALASLLGAKIGGAAVGVLTLEDGALIGDARSAVWTEDRANVIVRPPPGDVPESIELSMAIKPTQAAGFIASEQFEQYAEYIALGALARLLKLRGMKWADLGAAEDYKTQFDEMVGEVHALVSHGHGRGTTRVKPQWM